MTKTVRKKIPRKPPAKPVRAKTSQAAPVLPITPPEPGPAPLFPDVMLDIETLSTDPANAIIVSVGALQFALTPDKPVFGRAIKAALDPREQLMVGRVPMASTVDFWKGQEPAARNAWMNLPMAPLAKILPAISDLFGPETRVWAWGVVFDIGNVAALYREHGVKVPWKYNAVMDARTACAITNPIRPVPEEDLKKLVAHDPLDDCLAQVWKVWSHIVPAPAPINRQQRRAMERAAQK